MENTQLDFWTWTCSFCYDVNNDFLQKFKPLENRVTRYISNGLTKIVNKSLWPYGLNNLNKFFDITKRRYFIFFHHTLVPRSSVWIMKCIKFWILWANPDFKEPIWSKAWIIIYKWIPFKLITWVKFVLLWCSSYL